MCFFKKRKNRDEPIIKDLSRINVLYTTTEMLIHAIDDYELKSRLEKVGNIIKYLPPTQRVDSLKVEGKIEAKLDDLKVALSSKKDASKIESLILEIELLVIERKNIW